MRDEEKVYLEVEKKAAMTVVWDSWKVEWMVGM